MSDLVEHLHHLARGQRLPGDAQADAAQNLIGLLGKDHGPGWTEDCIRKAHDELLLLRARIGEAATEITRLRQQVAEQAESLNNLRSDYAQLNQHVNELTRLLGFSAGRIAALRSGAKEGRGDD